MRLSEFDYKLPEGLIAQYPAKARDGSRLMVVHRISRKIEHRNFCDIVDEKVGFRCCKFFTIKPVRYTNRRNFCIFAG